MKASHPRFVDDCFDAVRGLLDLWKCSYREDESELYSHTFTVATRIGESDLVIHQTADSIESSTPRYRVRVLSTMPGEFKQWADGKEMWVNTLCVLGAYSEGAFHAQLPIDEQNYYVACALMTGSAAWGPPLMVDSIGSVLSNTPPPTVEELSLWSDLDFQGAAYDFAHLGVGRPIERGWSFTAGESRALARTIEFTAVHNHPVLRGGLLCLLRFDNAPISRQDNDDLRSLNFSSWLYGLAPTIGAWCVRGDRLHHVVFIPNFLRDASPNIFAHLFSWFRQLGLVGASSPMIQRAVQELSLAEGRSEIESPELRAPLVAQSTGAFLRAARAIREQALPTEQEWRALYIAAGEHLSSNPRHAPSVIARAAFEDIYSAEALRHRYSDALWRGLTEDSEGRVLLALPILIATTEGTSLPRVALFASQFSYPGENITPFGTVLLTLEELSDDLDQLHHVQQALKLGPTSQSLEERSGTLLRLFGTEVPSQSVLEHFLDLDGFSLSYRFLLTVAERTHGLWPRSQQEHDAWLDSSNAIADGAGDDDLIWRVAAPRPLAFAIDYAVSDADSRTMGAWLKRLRSKHRFGPGMRARVDFFGRSSACFAYLMRVTVSGLDEGGRPWTDALVMRSRWVAQCLDQRERVETATRLLESHVGLPNLEVNRRIQDVEFLQLEEPPKRVQFTCRGPVDSAEYVSFISRLASGEDPRDSAWPAQRSRAIVEALFRDAEADRSVMDTALQVWFGVKVSSWSARWCDVKPGDEWLTGVVVDLGEASVPKEWGGGEANRAGAIALVESALAPCGFQLVGAQFLPA